MAISARARARIPASSFVYPPGSRIGGKRGKYPINTRNRARSALKLSGKGNTAGSYRTVAAAVHRRYPAIGR